MRRILSGTYHIFNDARVSSRVLKLNPSIQRLQPPARNIHASPVLLAKAKVKKAGKDKKNDTVVDDDVEITLPDLDNLDTTMEGKVNFLKFELGKIRGGHATSDMLDFVTVNAYGDNIPITDTAQITLKSATKLVVATYDADITSHVATAIRECGLGFAPTVDGTNITITVPKPSKEARANLVKVATQHAEKVIDSFTHAQCQSKSTCCLFRS